MQNDIFKPQESARVLVVGDIILDQYIYGDTNRISPEAPVPVVKVASTEERPGGAANVAVNVSSLGVAVKLLGITGEDDASRRLTRLLDRQSVDYELIKQADFSTIAKMRILSQHQQLLRLDYEQDGQTLDDSLLQDSFEASINSADVVVLSDYAKGSLKNITALINLAKQKHVPVLIDPKSIDFNIYRNASLITPNLKEFEAVAGHCATEQQLVEKAQGVCEQFGLEGLLVTRGEHGMTLIQPGNEVLHLKAESHEVYDVTGAGDTVIATLAAALACNYDMGQATALANMAAGMVVEKLGAATVTVAELNAKQPARTLATGIMDSALAADTIQIARSNNERIVMTNGCFDILHSGHISYLEQARALGDKLLVAVNSDDSVRELKGDSRPVNPLPDRMKILSALSCVDMVVAFGEQTPAALIELLQPDILVKGGDYTEDQIAGAEFVKTHGGEVVILPFQEGCSTSLILEKIKNNNGVDK